MAAPGMACAALAARRCSGRPPPAPAPCVHRHFPPRSFAPRCRRDLSAAIWRPELGLAEVVLQRGKLLAHMGFTRGGKLYLFVEEAL